MVGSNVFRADADIEDQVWTTMFDNTGTLTSLMNEDTNPLLRGRADYNSYKSELEQAKVDQAKALEDQKGYQEEQLNLQRESAMQAQEYLAMQEEAMNAQTSELERQRAEREEEKRLASEESARLKAEEYQKVTTRGRRRLRLLESDVDPETQLGNSSGRNKILGN